MRLSVNEMILAAIVIGSIGAAGWRFLGASEASSSARQSSIRVPEFTSTAVAGQHAFEANCAKCHGANGVGTNEGPPLLNDIYNPGHHPDAAFQAAVRRGVPRHHWSFGDMPAQPQVSEEQVRQIVRYMRELQQANGIVYREHRM